MQSQIIEPIFGGEFPVKVIPLIEAAIKSIKIIVFDWRWYPTDPASPCQKFNNALIAAKKRCVEISVLTNCNDTLNILRSVGIKAKKPISRRLLHSKIIIIDEKILIIGSHNYTQNAFTSNFEASVILNGCDDLTKFVQYFNALCV